MSKSQQSTDPTTVEEFLRKLPDADYRTIQGGEGQQWTDARAIREEFGVAPYNPEQFDERAEGLVPDLLTHSWDPPSHMKAGGTDLLATGKPGTGKSTLAIHLAVRLIDINNERLVWRGSASRSEWLPLAPWVTLVLPETTEYSARFVPRRPTDETIDIPKIEQLEGRVVREIKRYRNPRHLNEKILEPGQVHVVYPDPEMQGCQGLLEDAAEKSYDLPQGRETLFHPDDPDNHWWFAWVLARVEHGPHKWTTLMLDEIGDIAEQAARKDSFGSYQKVQLLRDAWVDARKMGLTIFAFGHSEKDIHSMIRRKIRWRVAMNGSANPTTASDVVGFDSVKMNYDHTSSYDVGEGLIYSEQNFEKKITWDDYDIPVSHKLKLETVGDRR
ncbi:ATP-binding protein [Halohasta salina]|uniref:ATP-binding protein n=1 Tax=Halohasta salina TaxID=2961621 RepID=UPI0020A4A2BB|nr:ATP-binding protein [Halohasta salina]